MRITKSRLMRGTTINPNPPICKSKEPSFTYIQIFSCADDHLITEIAHYNWNLTQALAAADGGRQTYTKGYFYEAAFKKTTSLDRNNCVVEQWYCVWPKPNPGQYWPGATFNVPIQERYHAGAPWGWMTFRPVNPYSRSGQLGTPQDDFINAWDGSDNIQATFPTEAALTNYYVIITDKNSNDIVDSQITLTRPPDPHCTNESHDSIIESGKLIKYGPSATQEICAYNCRPY